MSHHPAGTSPEATLLEDPAVAPVVAGPTPRQVVLLQSVREYPAVSVLLNTTPARAMTPPDVARLGALTRDAARRLRAEGGDGSSAALTTLERVVLAATAGPTATALAVFASRSAGMVVPLPVPVRERVVVDPTFATRDLVRALHRTPRHLLLALDSQQARLFEGVGGLLRPAVRSSFPLEAERRRGTDRGRPRRPAVESASFFRAVDRALRAYLTRHPAPLLLAGSERNLAEFTRVSGHLPRLAGCLPVNVTNEPLASLARRAEPLLAGYLRSRQDEALRLLELRASASRVVSGMSSAWLAARTEPVEMLAVEEGLFYPARLSADGDLLLPADDPEHPDVVDDAVDELIETVLDRGGWVALVDDGVLAAHEGVALTVSPGRGR